ncbi:hypothetical protein [Glycocaulis sp.]
MQNAHRVKQKFCLAGAAGADLHRNCQKLLNKKFNTQPEKFPLALLLRLPHGFRRCETRLFRTVAAACLRLQGKTGMSRRAIAMADRAERETRTRMIAVTGLITLVLVIVLTIPIPGAVVPA